jgi:hypothetical protein
MLDLFDLPLGLRPGLNIGPAMQNNTGPITAPITAIRV